MGTAKQTYRRSKSRHARRRVRSNISMGRGAYEHNYVALDLDELRAPYKGTAPATIPFRFAEPAESASIAADLYCGDNLRLADWLLHHERRFRLIYIDPP